MVVETVPDLLLLTCWAADEPENNISISLIELSARSCVAGSCASLAAEEVAGSLA